MAARAEREPGLKMEHRATFCVIFVLPCRADEQAFAYFYRVKILLPVVLPVGILALGEVNLILYSRRRKPFDIANMVVPYGIYIEDYSDLEREAMEIAHIDLIDEDLLAKDRTKGIVHIYIDPQDHPQEAAAFLTERLAAAGIENEIYLYFCPVHRLSLFYQLRLEIGVVAVMVIELAVVERPLAGSEFAGLNIPARLLDLIYLRVERVERRVSPPRGTSDAPPRRTPARRGVRLSCARRA